MYVYVYVCAYICTYVLGMVFSMPSSVWACTPPLSFVHLWSPTVWNTYWLCVILVFQFRCYLLSQHLWGSLWVVRFSARLLLCLSLLHLLNVSLMFPRGIVIFIQTLGGRLPSWNLMLVGSSKIPFIKLWRFFVFLVWWVFTIRNDGWILSNVFLHSLMILWFCFLCF